MGGGSEGRQVTENPERAIGKLEGQMTALVAAFETLAEKSDLGRSRIYSELEHIRADNAESRRDVSGLKRQLDEYAPTIADVKKWRERFIGMQILIVFVTGSVVGTVVAFWKWIMVKVG